LAWKGGDGGHVRRERLRGTGERGEKREKSEQNINAEKTLQKL